MKKLLFTIIMLLIPFFLYAEECNTDKVNIKSIELIDHTNGVEENNDVSFEGNTLYIDLDMKYLNDSAEYRLIIENKSDQDFELNKTLSNSSNYIQYIIEPADETYVISKNSEKEFLLTVKYVNEVSVSDFYDDYYIEEKEVVINISEPNKEINNDSGINSGHEVEENPDTGYNDIILIIIGVSSVILFIAVYTQKYSKIFIVLFFIMLIPIVVNAVCTKELKINSYVSIKKTYEGMLMGATYNEYLRTDINRDKITKITFTNSLGNHKATDNDCYDVSVLEDGSVLAWITSEDSNNFVTLTIGAEGKVYASDGAYLFGGLMNLESIEGMQYFDTSRVTNMKEMFASCAALENLDLSHFDTSNVTDMSGMFAMYAGSGFINSNLTSIDLSSFDTSNVTDMSYMFYRCNNLTNIDLSHFDTSQVTDMGEMFSGCASLTQLNLRNFNTSNVEDMYAMFSGCSSLTQLNVSSFDTSKITNMKSMFSGCSSLTQLNVSSFDTLNVTTMQSMFYGCNSLTSLNLNNFNTSKVTIMEGMFSGCTNLESLNISSFDTSNVYNMYNMFNGLESLETLDLSNFNTSNVKLMHYMFANAISLTQLNLSGFNTSKVTDIEGMFNGCTSLTQLDLSSFNTSALYTSKKMFSGCTNLRTIIAGDGFNLSSVAATRTVDMFKNCTSLVGGAGTTFNSSYTDKTRARIDGGTSSPGYFTSPGL